MWFFFFLLLYVIFCYSSISASLENNVFYLKVESPLAVGPRGPYTSGGNQVAHLYVDWGRTKMWKKLLSSVRKKKKQRKERRGWALSHAIGSEEADRKVSWLLRPGRWPLYMYTKTFYWLHELPRCRTPLNIHHQPPTSTLRRQHERFSGRVQEHLHGRPLQAGLRLRGRRLRWEPAAPGEARRQVQVLEAGVPTPVEGEAAHRQLAAQVQAEEVDPGRHRGGADGRHPAHSARWVVAGKPLHAGFSSSGWKWLKWRKAWIFK